PARPCFLSSSSRLSRSRRPPRSPASPTRRSSDLVAEHRPPALRVDRHSLHRVDDGERIGAGLDAAPCVLRDLRLVGRQLGDDGLDRKSTRLHSSHVKISYAVFCLKKKTG